MKRLVAFLLTLLMVLSLAACGSSSDEGSTATDAGTEPADGFSLKNEESVALGSPEKTLDPESVYSKLTYTPKMFYGEYSLQGGNEAQEKFGSETKYSKWTIGDKELELSTLPVTFLAGPNTFAHMVNYVTDYNWARVSFMCKDEYGNGEIGLNEKFCAYTVEGNKLTLKPLDSFDAVSEDGKISYAFSDVVWEYTFSFSGRNLTLSNGEDKIILTAGLEPYHIADYFNVDNYLTSDSKAVANIDSIGFRYDAEDGDSRFYVEMLDGTSSDTSNALLEENGLFTITLDLDGKAKTYQYVYFYCYDDGLILTDGTEVYYYTDSYSDRNKTNLREYLTEDQTAALNELSESQLEAIVEKKENLMDDLADAFNAAGIKVSVDQKSGELAMDSSILFGGDSAVLTAEGKDFLNKFVEAYTSIIFSEKYEGFVEKTMVEGHTAPVAGSTYESGLPLSEERAKNVKDYCVSAETGVDTAKLAAALDAVGYSNSKPVKDADGNVDAAASRRVSFRFVINLDQA